MTWAKRVVIVTADDLGLSPGVNRGIEEAHRRGIVTAVSVMANTPFFDEAMEVLARNPKLDPGVHLCLGPGIPVAPPDEVGSLIGSDGRLRSSHAPLWRGLLTKTITVADVEREWRAQIERVVAAGVVPSHVDSHGHLHFFPSLFELAVRLASEYRIGAVRGGRPVLRPLGARWWVWAVLITNWWLSQRDFEGYNVASPRWLAGVPVTGHLSPAVLGRLFKALHDGVTELICHPGYEDQELRDSGDAPLPGRAQEMEALCSSQLPAGVELSTFRAQWGSSGTQAPNDKSQAPSKLQ